MPHINEIHGDVCFAKTDIICGTTNPYLNLSGGVGGAVRELLGDLVQLDLHAFLHESGRSSVIPGSVIKSRCKLNGRILYFAVSTDVFSQSSVEIVTTCIKNILRSAREDRARTISIPKFGTGYGRLTEEQFRLALENAFTGNQNSDFVLQVFSYPRSDQMGQA